MRFGSTLALIGVAAAFGLYTWKVDLPREQARQDAESSAKKLLDFKRDAVVGLELPVEEGGRARVVREKRGDAVEWRIEQPRPLLAEEPSVTGLLTGFERLESEFQIENPPADLKPFGFKDEDRVVIELAQGEPLRITLGGDTPVEAQRYVRLEGHRNGIFGVKKSQTSGLTTSVYRLRDKRISAIDPKDVTSVKVVRGGALLMQAEPAADAAADAKTAPAPDAGSGEELKPREWKLTAPVADRGDLDRIQRLLQDVYFARASSFVDDPKDLKSLGLDKPQAEIDLVAKNGVSEQLRIGKSDKVYLQVGDRTPVYEVPERLLDGLGVDPFTYRYKRVLTVPEREPRRVELLFPRDGAQYAFVRDGDEGAWQPESKDLKLRDPGKVDDLLLELYGLDASSLIDKPDRASLGLEPPQLRVTVRGEQGKELGWLELGNLQAGTGIAVSSSQSDRTWMVRPEIGAIAPIGIAGFRERWQQPEGKEGEPAPAQQIGPHGIPLPLPAAAPQEPPAGSGADAPPGEAAPAKSEAAPAGEARPAGASRAKSEAAPAKPKAAAKPKTPAKPGA